MKKRRSPTRSSAAKAPAESPRAPTYDDILAIARLIESGSRFSEFRLRSGDIEVEVRRANGAAREGEALGPGRRGDDPSAVAPAQAGAQSAAPPASSAVAANAGNWAPASAAAAASSLPPGTQVIRSPMVGTCYRAPEPGAPPFVEPGTRVSPDSIVCIIEVMKLMNSVTAGVSGIVTHVFVENAQMVEYGQPLIAIRPD